MNEEKKWAYKLAYHKHTRGPLIALITAFSLFSLLVPVFVVLNNRETQRKRSIFATNYAGDNPRNPSEDDFSGIQAMGYITSINTQACVVKMHFDLFSHGQFQTRRKSKGVKTMVNINATIYYGHYLQVPLEANKRMITSDISIPLLECDTNRYPLDVLSLNFFSSVLDSNSSPVPLIVYIHGGVQGFSLQTTVIEENEEVFVKMRITRSWTTIFFSLFVIILMWCLGIGSLLLTITYIHYEITDSIMLLILTCNSTFLIFSTTFCPSCFKE